MKTKIIYISGNEVFDIRDVRAAFEEVRNALNLDKDTVLFGVPVDNEDAGLSAKTDEVSQKNTVPEIIDETNEQTPDKEIIENEFFPEITSPEIDSEIKIESVDEQPTKKRGRPRKENITENETVIENHEPASETHDVPNDDEKIVPILSVLSTKDDENETVVEKVEIIQEITDDTSDEIVEGSNEKVVSEQTSDDEADLEKLLSAMTPLDESENPDIDTEKEIQIPSKDTSEDISVDLTLERLATEFAENQDKIASETKSSSRNRIGKLRNILPFKQSKHKDTGLGDLFGWAGMAANDEEFSVPGFFTNAASRK